MARRVLIAGGGTGGHLYPALNIAAALRRADPEVELLLVGAERGIEGRVLPEAGYAYRLLPSQPLHRSRPWRNWRVISSAPRVLREVASAFRSLKPQVVVGTGGYAAAPALAYAIAARIPTVLQEQNAFPGLVTRMLFRHAAQLHFGYPEAAEHLRVRGDARSRFHGNPVAVSAPAGDQGGSVWPEGRLILVTGGSQGARDLNHMLLRELAAATRWPDGTTLVWISGPAHHESVAAAIKASRWADRVRVLPYVDALGSRLSRIDLAISRAGAMSTSELAAAGVPALLVPLPSSAEDHQRRNAMALETAGAAKVFEQDSAPVGQLWSAVVDLLGQGPALRRMAEAMRSRGRPDAADRIAADVLSLAGGTHADD